MSRSIDTRGRDLRNERSFSRTDDAPNPPQMTKIEEDGVKKIIYKANEINRRQAEKQNTPAYAEIVKKESNITRKVVRRKREPEDV